MLQSNARYSKECFSARSASREPNVVCPRVTPLCLAQRRLVATQAAARLPDTSAGERAAAADSAPQENRPRLRCFD